MYTILRREAFSETTFLWEVLAPDVARAARPGHFVMVRLHEGSERIPLTIADFDAERGSVTLVVQALGKTMFDSTDLATIVVDAVRPIREKLLEYEANPDYAIGVLAEGAERARAYAEPKMRLVRERMGLTGHTAA